MEYGVIPKAVEDHPRLLTWGLALFSSSTFLPVVVIGILLYTAPSIIRAFRDGATRKGDCHRSHLRATACEEDSSDPDFVERSWDRRCMPFDTICLGIGGSMSDLNNYHIHAQARPQATRALRTA